MHRIRFEKTGRAVWMSHLDLMRLMQRAFRRAGVVLHHSQGFTPHAYVSMLLPLSVGMESVCELMEYELDGELAVTPEALNAVLPEGVRVLEVYESTRKARELRRLRALLTLEYDGAVPEPAAITTLLDRTELVVEKRTKRGMAETDIRPKLHAYHVEAAPGAAADVRGQRAGAVAQPHAACRRHRALSAGSKAGLCPLPQARSAR